MATFTMELKEAIRLTGGTVTYVDGIARLTGGNVGLSDYPLWKPEYRSILTGKIVDHYFNREIGMETIDMFQLAMRRKLNEIMPFYNQLYRSTELEFDPLSTVNMTTLTSGSTTQTTNNTGTSSTNTDSDSKARSVSSDFPQTRLAGNEDYATSQSDSVSNSAGTSNAVEDSASDTEAEANSESTVKGYQGIPSQLLMSYRASLLNIDINVINDLDELFMAVWSNGDSFTNTAQPLIFGYGRLYW